ncbi:MAG: hypothetical protein ACTHU0_33915 [Kofleriaceae bacterium]
MWNRREFCATLGWLAACNGAASSPKEPSKEDRVRPPATEGVDIVRAHGPAPFAFDGDRLIELRDGTIVVRDVRDAKLAETAKLAIAGATGFAVLPDHSLAVRAGGQLHHVVGTAVRASYAGAGDRVAATDQPDEVWIVDRRAVTRVKFGTDKLAGMLVPRKVFDLPEGLLPGFATLVDGSLVRSTHAVIVQATATALRSFAWMGYSRHLGPGPDASSVWASIGFDKVALVALAGDTAKAIATHPLASGESIADLAGHGAHAAAVIGRGIGEQARYELVVYTAKGERWRAPLGTGPELHQVALDATRVVVRTQPGGALRGWDLATGKPLG